MRYWGSGEDSMKPKNPSLSAIIIAKNEEVRIGKCLEALRFAAERIVLDNGSTDETPAVARKHGATVHSFHSDNFAKLRNEAAELCSNEWLLYVDADEVVTPELSLSIRQTIAGWKKGDAAGFEIHRKNFYLGKPWPSGEWMLRLFRTDSFRQWQGTLHETPVIQGDIARIRGDMLHDTHRTLSGMVLKTNEWSETEAQLRKAIHHPPVTWWRIIRVMLTGFWDSYVTQGGWRAGTVGWIESVYQGFSMFITYAKLWELQEKEGVT